MKVYGFRVMLVFVMYYIYVTSGSSLLIESTVSMKIFFSATKVYIDDVLTCRAWKRDSVANKKRLSS